MILLLKSGETFSFCGTIGEPTADKGYKEADSFDTNRKNSSNSWWWQLPS